MNHSVRTLRVSIDTKLAPEFDLLATSSNHAAHSADATRSLPPAESIYTSSHPRYATVTSERVVNPCAQTVLLSSSPPLCSDRPREEMDLAAVDLFLFLDALQAPRFLLKPARTGQALEHYLGAICEATANEFGGGVADERGCRRRLRLHVVIAPNVVSRAVGEVHPNVNHVNVSSKEAASLFTMIIAWVATHSVSGYSVEAGLLASAPSPLHAVHSVLASANKRLKQMVEYTKGAEQASSSGAAMPPWMRDIRPDRAKKCDPHDFHRLYTSMLTEVSSFSERKTIAAVTTFPTMHHLLLHVDRTIVNAAGGPLDEKSSGTDFVAAEKRLAAAAVYNCNFDESRSWNVVNHAIVDALITDYRQDS